MAQLDVAGYRRLDDQFAVAERQARLGIAP
jgi:hypothetical protein